MYDITQDDNWKQILESHQDNFIIWGKNHIGELLSDVLSQYDKKVVYFWDTYKTGVINGIKITPPPEPFAKAGKDVKACCVILTFESDKNNQNYTKILKNSGFIDIKDGRILIQGICDAKIGEDREKYGQKNKRATFHIRPENDYIFKDEWLKTAGVPVSDEYFQQDLWAAQKVFEDKPEVHYDIGSSISGFIAHLLSFQCAQQRV